MHSSRPYRQIIDGVPRCPWLDPAVFRKSLSFRAAKGDLIQSSFVKSGAHYVQYLIQLILKHGGPVSSYNEFTSNTRLLEYMDCSDWKASLPMRLFFTHQTLRPEMMNDEAKYVYVARNPWDVCTSLFRMVTDMSIYRFQDGTFEEFLDPFMEGDLGYGDYFDHVASGYAFKEEPNVFFVSYEDLTKDTCATVLKLANFMGERYGRILQHDDQILNNILEWSKPEHMRKVVVFDLEGNQTREWNDVFVRNEVKSKQGYEGDYKKYSIVREARVGSWKDYFTTSQLVRFEQNIQSKKEKAGFMHLWSDIREEAIAISNA